MADAFQPRFVDLVRNYSTTTGTSDFVLGPAVNGYSGLASALSTGDRFYYSAVGVDKPAEREVGRGTLLTGGVVKREPVSGAKTNFTSGTKSIALIAAAEWFDEVNAAVGAMSPTGQALTSAASASDGRNVLGLGSASIADADADATLSANSDTRVPTQKAVRSYGERFPTTFADRAGLAAAAGGTTAHLRESGREGMFVWDPSDQSAMVAGDPRQALYVAPASDPTGASGAWVRKYGDAIDVRWFGTKGDNASDDGAAFQAALSLAAELRVTSGYGYGGAGAPTLLIPHGKYFLGTSTLDVLVTMNIVGEGSHLGGPATVLRWADGATGIRVQSHNTSGATGSVASRNYRGTGSMIRNLFLRGGYAGTEGEFHGLHLRAAAIVDNVYVSNFPGDGIYAVASLGDPVTDGNVSGAKLNNVRCESNRNGLFFDGADANACTIIGGDFRNNRMWGVWDDSFLGNYYFGCQTTSNGSDGSAGSVPTGCSYSGNRYYVKPGQAAGASTNAPSGTTADNTWWGYKQAGTVFPGVVPWVSGTTFREGGSFKAYDPNQTGVFVGCYDEGDNNRPQILAPNQIFGGHISNYSNGFVLKADSSGYQQFGFQVGTPKDGWITINNNNVTSGINFRRWSSAGVATLDATIWTASGQLIFDHTTKHSFRIAGNNKVALLATSLAGMIDNDLDLGLAAQRWKTVYAYGANVAGPVTATGAIGYGTGAGAAVVQATSKSTGVTLNKPCGQVTMNAAALAAGASVAFTVTNSQVAATDTVSLSLASGNATAGTYNYQVDRVSAGSFVVAVKNISAGSLSEALVFNFAVLKAVAA